MARQTRRRIFDTLAQDGTLAGADLLDVGGESSRPGAAPVEIVTTFWLTPGRSARLMLCELLSDQ